MNTSPFKSSHLDREYTDESDDVANGLSRF